jgi:hypothetical protein
LVLAEDSDYSAIVTAVLDGACPRPLGWSPEGPVIWLEWLGIYLRGLDAADALSRALAMRIEDDAPFVRGRVLEYFARAPWAEGFDRILDWAERSSGDLLRGYPVPEILSVPRPWETLWRAVARRSPERDELDGRLMRLVRQVLTTPRERFLADEVGASSTELEAERMRREGKDLAIPVVASALRTYERVEAEIREDVPRWALAEEWLFDVADGLDDDDYAWFARSIVEIERAGAGRWRHVLDLLRKAFSRDRSRESFLVIALIALIQSGIVPQPELRAWVDAYPYQREAFLVPVRLALDAEQAN